MSDLKSEAFRSQMEESDLFNLTVVELRSLCGEKGLETAKLRKAGIVELLLENGGECIECLMGERNR